GRTTVHTIGSSFDTTLGVYTGDAVNATTTVATDDDSSGADEVQTAITFDAVAGTTYHISLDGHFNLPSGPGDSGSYNFGLTRHTPATDTPPTATALPTSPPAPAIPATPPTPSGEAGEPTHASTPLPNDASTSLPLNSVWYNWTAPTSGSVSIDTFGSGF